MSAKFYQPSSLVVHNVVVGGVRTSVRLEPAMWNALRDIAAQEGVTVNALITEISRRNIASGLTSGIRVFALEYYRSKSDRYYVNQGIGQNYKLKTERS